MEYPNGKAFKRLSHKIIHWRYKAYYLWRLLTTLTLAKAVNFCRNSKEFKHLTPILRSLPSQVVIDLTNICNLKCPLCPTGTGIADRQKGKMPFQLYEDILRQLANSTQIIHLYNWGEPLLLKDFGDYCRFAQKMGLIVSTSTNLNLKLDDKTAEGIIESGLDRLIVSLDGLSQATYTSYRKGGDFELVMRNLKLLISAKKRLRKKYPLIVLQMVRHKKNQQDTSLLGHVCRKIGADDFSIVDVLLPFGKASDSGLIDEWITKDRLAADTQIFDVGVSELGKPCFHLWKLPVINYDGTISPCCYVYLQKDDFAGIKLNGFRRAWNSASFVKARELFTRHDSNYIQPCCRCSIYRTNTSR